MSAAVGERVAVIGAGTMGAGIAAVFAAAGNPVALYSRSDATLALASDEIRDRAGDDARRVTMSTSLEACLDGATFVSENVAESLEVKQDLFRRIEEQVSSSCLLTTNTSSIPITSIAAGLTTPDRFVGLHWFNPPSVMPVVELIRSASSSTDAVAAVKEVCRRVGKDVIDVRRDAPGFVVNRLQYAMLREAIALVEAGVTSIEDVDRAVVSTLAPRWSASGPLELMDLAGLDTVEKVAGILYPELDRGEDVPVSLSKLVAAGDIGAKSGRGFYEWTPDDVRAAVAHRDEIVRHLTRGVRS